MLTFYVMDLDKCDPSEWADQQCEWMAPTHEQAAQECADCWAENADPERTYHVAVATREDGSDAREYIVVSRIVRIFEVKSSKAIGLLVAPVA